MKKRKNKFLFTNLLLFSISLISSCGNNDNHEISEYMLKLELNDPNFKIMQLSDIHLGLESNLDEQFEYLENNIKNCDPNLIVITGDTFLFSNENIVNSFFEFLDNTCKELSTNSKKMYYTFTYGNHDNQGDYYSYFINDTLNSYAKKDDSNCLFVDFMNDDLPGYANFTIDLNYNNDLKYRLYIIDSNSYYYNNLVYDYDVIKDEQLTHFENIYKNTSDKDFIGLAFFHIPLYEYVDANNIVTNNKENSDSYPKVLSHTGFYLEESAPGYTDEFHPFDRLYNMNVRMFFAGHDHLNNANSLFKKSEDKQEVILSYGVKSTNQIYHNENALGYKEINLNFNDDKNVVSLSQIKNVYIDYEN